MAKPICVIKYNADRLSLGNGEKQNVANVNNVFQDRFTDYQIFAYPENLDEELFQFQVFHEKDFTEIQYEELKKLITEAIEQKIKH